VKKLRKILPLICAGTILFCLPAYADDTEKKSFPTSSPIKGDDEQDTFLDFKNISLKGTISGTFQPIIIDGNYYLFYEFREKSRDYFLKTLNLKTLYQNGGYLDIRFNNIWQPERNLDLTLGHTGIYKLNSYVKVSEFYPLTLFALSDIKDTSRDKGQRTQLKINGELDFFNPVLLKGVVNLLSEQKNTKLTTDLTSWNNMNAELYTSLNSDSFFCELNGSVNQFKDNPGNNKSPWFKSSDQYNLSLKAGYNFTPRIYGNAEYSLAGLSSQNNRTNTVQKAKFKVKSVLLPDLLLKGSYQLKGKDSQAGILTSPSKYSKLSESYNLLSNTANLDLFYSGIPKTNIKAGVQWRNFNKNTQGSFNVLGGNIDAQTTVIPYSKLLLQYNTNYNLFNNWSWLVSDSTFLNNAYLIDLSNLKFQAQILPQLPFSIIGSYNLGKQTNFDNNINLISHTFGAIAWLELFDSLNLSYDFNYQLNKPSDNSTELKTASDQCSCASNYYTHALTLDYTLNKNFDFDVFYSWLSTDNAVKLNEYKTGVRANYRHGQGSGISIGYAIDNYDDKSFVNDDTLKYFAHIITLNLKHNF